MSFAYGGERFLPLVVVPDVHSSSCRLFQATDLICTLELIAAKTEGMMTKSEKRFCGSRRVLGALMSLGTGTQFLGTGTASRVGDRHRFQCISVARQNHVFPKRHFCWMVDNGVFFGILLPFLRDIAG